MKKFKIKDKVLISSIPATMTAFRKSLAKLQGKSGTITSSEFRIGAAIAGNYYLVLTEGKEIWLHEMNLELV
jgi:hypothetical protein